MSLRWRIALGLAAIATLVSTAGAAFAYFQTADRLAAAVDESLRSKAAELTAGPVGGRGDGDRDRQPLVPGCPPNALLQAFDVARLVTASGDALDCLPHEGDLRVAGAVRAGVSADGRPRLTTVATDDGRYRVIVVRLGPDTVFELGRSLRENDAVLDSLRTRLALLALVGVVTAAALGWLLATRIVKPIERLRDSAERIARTGDLDVDLPGPGADEVGSLAASFATMVGALAESRDRQRRLVTDASHELRTPLTSLQTNAELLGRGEQLTEAQRSQVSRGIQLEVGELTDLVSELVALARDPAGDDEPAVSIALATVAHDVVGAAPHRTPRPVTLAVDHGATVLGRPRALARAMSNLVDNAIKHGAGPIEVAIDGGRVTVRDHGPGIPEADLPHVFDRFYRADVARTEAGSGLGLAIVAQIVEHHGGEVFARNHPDGGAVVGFSLPTTPH